MTVAFWCVLVGVLLPYVCFGIARNRGRGPDGKRLRDNRNPRDFPSRIGGLPKRAWDAHVNAFEAFPGFAAAVIIAYLVHTPQNQIDVLAFVWALARVTHAAFYLTDKDKLRTASQIVSLACVLGLFVVAGWSYQ
jgi:uncharacterized MAPEG superfamily protein